MKFSKPIRTKFVSSPHDRKPGDSELRVDSRNGKALPPINFERDTGWPASRYQEWLAFRKKCEHPELCGDVRDLAHGFHLIGINCTDQYVPTLMQKK